MHQNDTRHVAPFWAETLLNFCSGLNYLMLYFYMIILQEVAPEWVSNRFLCFVLPPHK